MKQIYRQLDYAVIFTDFSVMIGAVSTVAGILIAQFIGAEESKEAWCSFDVSLICGIIMSVLFLLAAGVFRRRFLDCIRKI